jgi:hypothetical protein
MEVFVGIDAARAIGPGCAGRAVKRRAAWSSPGLVAIVLLGAALGATGCQAMQTQRQNTPEMIQQGNAMLDRQRILMSTGGLDDPYDKLGDLSYSEPFSPDAIDSTHINENSATWRSQNGAARSMLSFTSPPRSVATAAR